MTTQDRIEKMLRKAEVIMAAGYDKKLTGQKNSPKELELIVKTEYVNGFICQTPVGFRCPNCKNEIKDNVDRCPICGQLICDD